MQGPERDGAYAGPRGQREGSLEHGQQQGKRADSGELGKHQEKGMFLLVSELEQADLESFRCELSRASISMCLLYTYQELTDRPISSLKQGLEKAWCLVLIALSPPPSLGPFRSVAGHPGRWHLPETRPVGWGQGSSTLKALCLPSADASEGSPAFRSETGTFMAPLKPQEPPRAWPLWGLLQLCLQGSARAPLSSTVSTEVPRGAWGPSSQVIAHHIPGFQASVGICVAYMLSASGQEHAQNVAFLESKDGNLTYALLLVSGL